mmetsp:Transcript_16882/g.57808  ORF Transcript_16882/g.57808 Transcript_16882/m.57808 type:complete len:274 (-) Transcript_16882:1183-2004(-)
MRRSEPVAKSYTEIVRPAAAATMETPPEAAPSTSLPARFDTFSATKRSGALASTLRIRAPVSTSSSSCASCMSSLQFKIWMSMARSAETDFTISASTSTARSARRTLSSSTSKICSRPCTSAEAISSLSVFLASINCSAMRASRSTTFFVSFSWSTRSSASWAMRSSVAARSARSRSVLALSRARRITAPWLADESSIFAFISSSRTSARRIFRRSASETSSAASVWRRAAPSSANSRLAQSARARSTAACFPTSVKDPNSSFARSSETCASA